MSNFVIDNNANNIANLEVNSLHTEDLTTSSAEVSANLDVGGDVTMENMIVNTLAFDKLQIKMEDVNNSTVELKSQTGMTSAQVALKSQSDSVGILDFKGSAGTLTNGGSMDVKVSFSNSNVFVNDSSRSLLVMLSLETEKDSSVRLKPNTLTNNEFELTVNINEALSDTDELKVHYFIMETNTLPDPSVENSTKSVLTIQAGGD